MDKRILYYAHVRYAILRYDMKMIYVSRDNRAKVGAVTPSKTLIERHGFHKIPNSAIYRNASGQEDAICVVFQGRVLPYGDKQEKVAINGLCGEIMGTHFLGGKLDVDTSMGRFLSWLGKNGVTVFLILLGLMLLIGAINGG